jgi:bacterioferritin-associated ferredoxin
MYVCLCNGLTDRDIRRAADQGCTTVAGVYRSLGSEVNCGRCVPLARQLIDQQRELADHPQLQAAE